jgi:hypothetical protein
MSLKGPTSAMVLRFCSAGLMGRVLSRFSRRTMLRWAASSVRGTCAAVRAAESTLSGMQGSSNSPRSYLVLRTRRAAAFSVDLGTVWSATSSTVA